ncbi:ABC transporter ATP-binding protein [Streptomyces otsuchiensis]|uniref:ABC transporter ATP-binding protein n=1 Tax=Streptomyces otsuchiensis TaxID=2681388 RepID=UPI001030163E|nr:ABC transporter ATP-binding protein [Streptomyces otsuchiensis]
MSPHHPAADAEASGERATAAPETAAPILELRGLRVDIAGSRILQGVDLTVPATGVTALMGRNGVGKTTTVRAVLGLLPDEGHITGGQVLFGAERHDITREPTHATVRRGIGYAPEDRGVFTQLTVAENLALAERPGGTPDYALVHELFPELEQRRDQRGGTLSGGQQQMVAIARTLLNENRLIIVDEPTKGLAPRVVSEVTEVLGRAAARVPMLLVEQNLAVIRQLADRAVVLDAGRVVHTGPAAELLADRERTTTLLGVGRAAELPAAEPGSGLTDANTDASNPGAGPDPVRGPGNGNSSKGADR